MSGKEGGGGGSERPPTDDAVPSESERPAPTGAAASSSDTTIGADAKAELIVASREDISHEDGHETKVAARAVGLQASYLFQGPLPPPEVFAKYEKACRGAGGRILAMAEDQAKHRRELERNEQQALINDERRGQWMGFSIIFAAMGIGAWLIVEGYAIGVPAFFTGLAGLFGAVILKRLDERRERKKQEKEEADRKNRKPLPPAPGSGSG